LISADKSALLLVRLLCIFYHSRGIWIPLSLPLFEVLQALKRTDYLLPIMVEPTLDTEKVMPASMKGKEEQENLAPFLEQEIECPRCHDSMMLCSDFDNLYYVCEECDFCLYTIKK
jgi:hypothetical protein